MATFERRSGHWRAKVHRRGVKATRTFPTKLQAQEWAAQVERDAIAGEYRGASKESLGGAIKRFLKDVTPNRRGARWEAIRLAAFQARETRLCALPLASLDVSSLERWRDRRLSSVSSATVRREMALLGSVLSQAVRWGLIRSNPLKDVRKPISPPARRRGVSLDEIDAIAKSLGTNGAGNEIRLAFLLSLETGMRCGEILGLTWGHVNLAERYVTLPKTKNGDSRQVPLSTAAVEICNALKPDEVIGNVFSITGPTLDVLFRRARDRAAIDCPSCKTFRFHDARGEAITRLSRKLDVLELARVVGHRSPASLMFYYSKSAAEIAKKLD